MNSDLFYKSQQILDNIIIRTPAHSIEWIGSGMNGIIQKLQLNAVTAVTKLIAYPQINFRF